MCRWLRKKTITMSNEYSVFLRGKQQVFSENIAKLIIYAHSIGIRLTFGEAFRTPEQQAIHVKQGKSRTSNSYHLKRLAVDFNFFIDGELTYRNEDVRILGEYWERMNEENRWGGNFTSIDDTPHFEMNIDKT